MALSDERSRTLSLKRAVQKAARIAGLHVGRYPPIDSLAYHLKTLLHELDIDCVLDVGAHVGEYAAFLRDLGYAGEIHSFEPVTASFATLSKTHGADPRWRGHHVALGAEEGELTMNIYSGSVFNSFLPPNEGNTRFADHTRLVDVEKVRMRRLDGVLDEVLAARPGARIFLKMDTQGYDLQVVHGGGTRLDMVRALQTELAARPTYAGMPKLHEALGELDALGFDLTGVFPVARELDHLRVIEFDCVMCRKQP